MSNVAVQADPRRAPLVGLLRGGDVYGFLRAAEDYLREVPGDGGVCELAVRTWAGLGLATPARQLVERAALEAADRERLAEQLPPRDRRLPWSKLDQRFRANLEVFEQRTGLGEAVSRVWRASAAKLRLYVCNDGNYQVFSRLPDATGWLPALFAHNQIKVSDELKAQLRGQVVATLAINGLGLGYLVQDLIAATRDAYVNFSAPLIVIEPSLLAWAVVLHLHDLREALAEERVRICAGPDAPSKLEVELCNPERTPPVIFSAGPPWPGNADDQEIAARVDAARERRRETQRRVFQQVSNSLADRDRAWWARRLANAGKSEPSLTVIGITSRYTTVLQYAMRDLLAAFERLGHRTHLFLERDDHSHLAPLRLLQDVQRLKPDLFVIIDHLQREYENAFPDHIPSICWIQDQLPNLFCQEAGRGVRPMEFVMGHGVIECLTRFDYPPQRFLPCLIPTNPDQMLDAQEAPADLEPYECDVMYATNSPGTPAELHAQRAEPLGGAARRLFDAAYEALRRLMDEPWFNGDVHLNAVLADVERNTGLFVTSSEVRDYMIAALRSIADQHLRQQTIRAAACWADATGGRFHLYGRGWEQHVEFARFARGVVPHGKPLGRAFRAAKISLHAGCNSALHQRVLDGLCAGGFFLIRERPSDTTNDLSAAIHQHLRHSELAKRLWEHPDQNAPLRPRDLPEPHAGRLHRLLASRGRDPEAGTWITRDYLLSLKLQCELKYLPSASSIWPGLEQVQFRDEHHLVERIEHFLRNPHERRELAARMRTAVLERLTYDALVRDVLSFVQRSLAGETPSLLSF